VEGMVNGERYRLVSFLSFATANDNPRYTPASKLAGDPTLSR